MKFIMTNVKIDCPQAGEYQGKPFYRVRVTDNEEHYGTVSCSEELYKVIKEGGEPLQVSAIYNDKFKSLRLDV